MAEPIANVQNRLSIEGVETVSDAAKKAQGALDGLGKTAAKTDASTKLDGAGIDAKGIQSKTAQAGGAIAALTAAMGPAGAGLAEVGRSATAMGAAANIIPGPIGLVTAAVVGLVAGAYLLNKSLAESKAKLDLLGNSTTQGLKDNLNLSTDAAVGLSQAIEDLKDKGLAPSEALLKQIGKNAESMGKDGGEAMTAFVKASAAGGDELKKFQQEYGRLNGLIADTSALTAQIGVSDRLLGLTKSRTQAETEAFGIAQDIARLKKDEAELAVGLARETELRTDAVMKAGTIDRFNAKNAANEESARNELIRQRIQNNIESLHISEKQAAERQKDLDALTDQKAGESVLDAQVAATAGKKNRAHAQDHANILKTTVATAALAKFDAEHAGILDAKLRTDRAVLEVVLLQAKAAQIQAAEAKKAEQSAGAAAALAQRQQLFEIQTKLLIAEIDKDGLRTEQERNNLLDLEQQKELDATSAIKSGKVRALAKLAIDQEYAGKRRELERTLAKETEAVNAEVFKTLEEQNKRSVDLAKSSGDAIASVKKATSTSLAAALRAQGADERADLTERAQAQADYAAAVNVAEAARIAALGKGAADTVDAANIIAEADAKKAQAALALEDIEKKIDIAATERQRAKRADAVDSLEGPAKALQSLAALGKGFESAGALGTGLTVGIKGFKDLDKAMKGSATKASEVTAAIGDAAAGIASGVIDADTKRTVSALDNDEQRALSTAKSESERAEITRKYEDAKAKAVEDAERKKALISALVEGAKAIASAATYDFIGAAGHAAAAIAFGAVAGGAGGSAAPSTSGLYGGLNSASPSGGGGGATGGQGSTTIINFNQPLVTKQEIGKAVHGALRSLQGTGTDKAKGA